MPDTARTIIEQTLALYGLQTLTDRALERFTDGISVDELLLWVRETPEFAERFPIFKLRQDAGQTPVSVNDVLAYEQAFIETSIQAGLPSSFYQNRVDIQTRYLATDQSINEIRTRINEVFVDLAQADPFVRGALEEFYGADTPHAIAALALDTEIALPELLEIATTAEIGGASRRFGFSATRDRAVQLAELGTTQDQANQVFAQLDANRRLFEESVSENVNLTAEGEGFDALAGIGSGVAVTDRALSRSNAFGGVGGVETTRQGLSGL